MHSQESVTHAYISAQQTATLLRELFCYRPTVVKASSPPFNVRKKIDIKLLQGMGVCFFDEIEQMSVPVYSPSTYQALDRLLHFPSLREYLETIGLRLPKLTFDTFFLRKLSKIQDLADFVRKNDEPQAAEKIEAFVKFLEGYDFKNTTPNEWYKALRDFGLPDDWDTKTHYRNIYQLFGVSAELSQKILKAEIEIKKSPFETEYVNLAHHSRWLGKALGACKLGPGCLTDVVNGIFSMMNKEQPVNDEKSELVVNRTIDEFVEVLRDRKWGKLWVPDVHLHDAEADDMILNGVFKYVRFQAGMPLLKTVVQLPQHEMFRNLAACFQCETFRDPDSDNGNALRSYWGITYNGPK